MEEDWTENLPWTLLLRQHAAELGTCSAYLTNLTLTPQTLPGEQEDMGSRCQDQEFFQFIGLVSSVSMPT